MRLYTTILLFSIIICPTLAEVLTQSFVIRLKEMEQLIQDQKQVIEEQRSLNADWNETLNDNTMIITEQNQVIQDQKRVIESLETDWNETLNNNTKIITEQEQVIQEQKQTIEYQRHVIESLNTDIHFTVGFSDAKTFARHEIIKFDRILTNVGGGYIDDANSTDYGKFIAPKNGTYQFNANLFSYAKMGADFQKNDGGIIALSNTGEGGAGASVILDLMEGDEVWVKVADSTADGALFVRYYSTLSGFLIHEF